MEKYGEGKEPIKIAFGSATSRLILPENPPPSRGGIEAGLRGAQNRGPGCYGPTPIELFLKELDSRPRSKHGVMFGASTASRFANMRKEKSPGPTTYQHETVAPIQPAYKPFGSSTLRVGNGINQQQQQPEDSPGPGHYQHDIVRNRHVEVMGSFGGTALLKETVIIKCTNGIKDQCELCHCPMVGDYWEKKINKKNVMLCHHCYEKQLQATLKQYQNLQLFNKVRDCSRIHKHDGTQALIQLKSDKEQKKLKYREAYLKLYYS